MRERERLIDRYIQKQRVRLKIGREKEEKPRVHQCITLCMYVVYLIIRVGLFSQKQVSLSLNVNTRFGKDYGTRFTYSFSSLSKSSEPSSQKCTDTHTNKNTHPFTHKHTHHPGAHSHTLLHLSGANQQGRNSISIFILWGGDYFSFLFKCKYKL